MILRRILHQFISLFIFLLLVNCQGKQERRNSSNTSPVIPTSTATPITTATQVGEGDNGNSGSGSSVVNGGWGAWTQWSFCDSNCQKKRWRFCDNPLPQNGGLNCTGLSQEIQNCTPLECQGNSGGGGSGAGSLCPTGFVKFKEVASAEHFLSMSNNYGIVTYCLTEQVSSEKISSKYCHRQNGHTYCYQKTMDQLALFYKMPDTYQATTLLEELNNLKKESYVLPLNTCNFSALNNIPDREMNKIHLLFSYQGFCPSRRVLCEQNHIKPYDANKFYIAVAVADAATKSTGVVFLKREDTYKFPNFAGMFLGSESQKVASYFMQICLPEEQSAEIVKNETKLTMVQPDKGYLHEFNFNSDRMHAVRIGEFWNYTKGSHSILLDPILNYTMPNLNINCKSISGNKYKWRLGYHSGNSKVVCANSAGQTLENVQSCISGSQWRDWNNKLWCLQNENQYYIAKGLCNPCPYGGEYDGANCLLGHLPKSGKIVDRKAYYYKTKPAPQYCETGDTLSTLSNSSAGMCLRTSISIHANAESFILNNVSIYYKSVCKISN